MHGPQVWDVVGGRKEGLLVRTGKSLKSPEVEARLAFGSLVEELALEGERLQYRLLSGAGPETGWVSLKLKGSDLLVRTDRRQPEAASASVDEVQHVSQQQVVEGPPRLELGGWRVLVAAAPDRRQPADGVHLGLCVICETGHMVPILRIARALCARPGVRKVSLVTNVFGARTYATWLAKDPDTSGKMEVVEFGDGWDREKMERANQRAQECDGSLHNECNDGIAEHARQCLQFLSSGEDAVAGFVLDANSNGFHRALEAIRVPQPIINTTALSTMMYVFMEFLHHGSSASDAASPSESKRPLDLVQCFELPPMLAATIPKLPPHALPVGIIADEVKLGKLPKDVADFLEQPGAPAVLYVSMGSVGSFTAEQLTTFVDALRAPGEWRVLWSLREAQQALLPSGGAGALGRDFFISGWLPQAEILQHASVVAFLSHCGWGACCEAIVAGKPVVAFPMFADQYGNAMLLETFGMARTVGEERIKDSDVSSFKRRMDRARAIEKGTIPQTRFRFTADGLRADIRAVLAGKEFVLRARGMQLYSSKFGGARKAAEEIEKAIAAWRGAAQGTVDAEPSEWPEAALERLHAVVKHRQADIVLAARSNMVCEVVLLGPPGGRAFVHICDGEVSVKAAGPDQADMRVGATEDGFRDAWLGKAGALKAFEISGEASRVRRVGSVLFFRSQDPDVLERRMPMEGFLRPPQGNLGPAPQPPASPTTPPPAWLVPDGLPAKKNKLLFISLPWAGHIIHLKRIAAWFADHPQYEVHFAYYSDKAPELPSTVTAHGAEASELCSIFDDAQDVFKEMAMQDDPAGTIELKKPNLEEASWKIQHFLTRIMLKVKPTVVLADSAFCVAGWLQGLCQSSRANVLFVVSPGLKEKWVAEGQGSPAAALATFSAEAGMSDINVSDVLSGKFDIQKLPQGVQDLLKLPGFDFLKMVSVYMAVMNPDPSRLPYFLYPSFSWMVEVPAANDREIFIGTLLPLPQMVNGSAQVSGSLMATSLEPELRDWLCSSASDDPVIYIAFGTIVKGVKQIVEKFAAALQGGPWRVLWSLPTEMQAWLPAALPPDRWLVRPFLPQKDIFRCDRVRCFVSHCGANSTIEALSCGVPMVCHPFYMDQYEWARTVRRHLRAGVQVDKFDSDAEALRLAVKEVLEQPSYRVAAQAVAKRLQAQAQRLEASMGPPMRPKDPLGPGVSVAAALVLSLMKGHGSEHVARMLEQSL